MVLILHRLLVIGIQIKLEGQISWGNSIRKVLVREAKLCAAKALIVGMGKFNAFG